MTPKEIYLYGSTSKLGDFEGDNLASFDEQSDFDFAVQDDVETEREISRLGWHKMEELAYQDSMTSQIYQTEIEGAKVQISLRYNLANFKEVWKSVPNTFYWQFLNKRSPSYIGREGVKSYLDQISYVALGHYKEVPKYTTMVKSSNLGINLRALEQQVWVNVV